MAIRVKGKIADHLLGAFLKVLVEKGWNYAERWLQNQGVDAQKVTTVPQLPPNHSYSYYTYEMGHYCWHFVDSKMNTHIKYVWSQVGPQQWNWVGPYPP
jgi:hypothetical protein